MRRIAKELHCFSSTISRELRRSSQRRYAYRRSEHSGLRRNANVRTGTAALSSNEAEAEREVAKLNGIVLLGDLLP